MYLWQFCVIISQRRQSSRVQLAVFRPMPSKEAIANGTGASGKDNAFIDIDSSIILLRLCSRKTENVSRSSDLFRPPTCCHFHFLLAFLNPLQLTRLIGPKKSSDSGDSALRRMLNLSCIDFPSSRMDSKSFDMSSSSRQPEARLYSLSGSKSALKGFMR